MNEGITFGRMMQPNVKWVDIELMKIYLQTLDLIDVHLKTGLHIDEIRAAILRVSKEINFFYEG